MGVGGVLRGVVMFERRVGVGEMICGNRRSAGGVERLPHELNRRR
jgi:hypothetical protein